MNNSTARACSGVAAAGRHRLRTVPTNDVGVGQLPAEDVQRAADGNVHAAAASGADALQVLLAGGP
jgi:hypothetical protein